MLNDSNAKLSLALYAFTSLALTALAWSVTKGTEVIWVNSRHTDWSDFAFAGITTFGDALVFIPAIVLLLFVRFYYAIIATGIWIISGVVCSILKRGIFSDARRPVDLLDHSALHFVPGINVHSHYSFPSGHTMTIFGITLLLALIVNKKYFSFLMILLALAVGYSRIYLLQHFLIDVAAGSILGCAITLLFWNGGKSGSIPSWMNNKLRPGSSAKRISFTDSSTAQ